MCELVEIKNNTNNIIKVASIKAGIIKKIIEYAASCSKIDYIYLFGSSVEERCTKHSDIDLAIISNIVRSRLYQNAEYKNFRKSVYRIDEEQGYDFIQFNSLDRIENGKETICNEILENGVIILIFQHGGLNDYTTGSRRQSLACDIYKEASAAFDACGFRRGFRKRLSFDSRFL